MKLVRETNIIGYHLLVTTEKKKKIQWTYLQNRNRLTENIEKLKVTKGEKGEGLNEEFGTNRHSTIYKTDKQGPMYSTGNCI